jgi:hypothetical protein
MLWPIYSHQQAYHKNKKKMFTDVWEVKDPELLQVKDAEKLHAQTS